MAYTSVIEGNQAGFSLEVQPGGAAAGPREGCMLTCLQLPAQPGFFLNPEPSARGRYHPVGWTLRLQPFVKKLLLPWSASRPFGGGILLPEGRPDSSACVKSIKKNKNCYCHTSERCSCCSASTDVSNLKFVHTQLITPAFLCLY